MNQQPMKIEIELKQPIEIYAWKMESVKDIPALMEECEGSGIIYDLEDDGDRIMVPGYDDHVEWRVGQYLVCMNSRFVDYHAVMDQERFDKLFVATVVGEDIK